MKDHKAGINELVLDDSKKMMFSAGQDNVIFVWNLSAVETAMKQQDVNSVAGLKGHQGEVTCLAFHEGVLYSGSLDGTVLVWNEFSKESIWLFFFVSHQFKEAKPLKAIKIDKEVKSLIVLSNDLICVGAGTEIGIWDTKVMGKKNCFDVHANTQQTEKLVAKANNESPVTCLTASDSLVLSGHQNGSIRVWTKEV